MHSSGKSTDNIAEKSDDSSRSDKAESSRDWSDELSFVSTEKMPDAISDRLRFQIEAYKELKALELLAPFSFALSICLLSIVAGLTTPHESELVIWGASYGPRTAHEYWRLVTALFLNTNPYLLCLNATATFVLGRALCLAMGPVVFCSTFLISGACSVMIATTASPQQVVFGSSFALTGLCGAVICCMLFKWRRRKIPFESLLFLILYAAVLAYSMMQGKIEISPEICGISFTVGMLCTLFWIWESKHWFFSTAAFVGVLMSFRFGLSSLPTVMDRFALDSSIQKLKILTRSEMTTLDEKYRHGELSDVEFANQLNIRILQPSRYVLAELSSIQGSQSKKARDLNKSQNSGLKPELEWLRGNRAELEYRQISLESMLAVLAARSAVLDADDLMKRGDHNAANRLDQFWTEQLPTLNERGKKIQLLELAYPELTPELNSLADGLDADIRLLLEGATNLEVHRTEAWLNHLRDQVISHTERMPAESESVSLEIHKQISDHAERLAMIDGKVSSESAAGPDEDSASHPDGQLERLQKLEAYVLRLAKEGELE